VIDEAFIHRRRLKPVNLPQAENAPFLVCHFEVATTTRQMDLGLIGERRLVANALV
jgi:hypothetical protein